MIGKMILHGVAAAAVIAGAAGLYAANAESGAATAEGGANTAVSSTDTGYLSPLERWFGKSRHRDDDEEDGDHDRRYGVAEPSTQATSTTPDTGYFVPSRKHGDRHGRKRHDD